MNYFFSSYLAKGVHLIQSHPCGLYALEKPEGLMSHPNTDKDINKSLIHAPYNLEEECYFIGNQRLYMLHRLDSPTSGLILLSSNKEIDSSVKKLFKSKQVSKTYHALVKGFPKTTHKLWVDRLLKTKNGPHLRIQAGQGQLAQTQWQSVWQKGPISCLALHPLSGLSHQLRVQCVSHQCPIIGDKTYGDFAFNRHIAKSHHIHRLCLHSSHIELTFIYKNQSITFNANSPLPDIFKKEHYINIG